MGSQRQDHPRKTSPISADLMHRVTHLGGCFAISHDPAGDALVFFLPEVALQVLIYREIDISVSVYLYYNTRHHPLPDEYD